MHKIPAPIILDIVVFLRFHYRHVQVITPPFLKVKNIMRGPSVWRKVVVRLEVRHAFVEEDNKSVSDSHTVHQLLPELLAGLLSGLLPHGAGHVLFLEVHQGCFVTKIHISLRRLIQYKCVLALGQGLLADHVQALKLDLIKSSWSSCGIHFLKLEFNFIV